MNRPHPVKQTRSRLEAGATQERPRAISATRSRGYLPHREGEHPIYFVTFRLADSLPRSLVLQLRRHRESTKKVTPAAEPGTDRARAHNLDGVLETAERCLDSGLGECHMRDSRIAKVVADAI
jgi:putative transposase